jgi:hypothetical protein
MISEEGNESMKKASLLASDDLAPPGFEAVYLEESDRLPEEYAELQVDSDGKEYMVYSLWGFSHTKKEDWNNEIKYINGMQQGLGKLNDDVRNLRRQIASLVCCDNGVPVTIDEILNSIGTGRLPRVSFHAGCWASIGNRSTQPNQTQTMSVIEAALNDYLKGRRKRDLISIYSFARGFIDRAFDWLGPVKDLTKLQKLMLERMLLPFEFFTKRNENHQAVHDECFSRGGKGEKLDNLISESAGLPQIYPNYRKEYRSNLEAISEPQKRMVYKICGHIANCVSELSDCHHNTFRFIERWIYAIGTLTWEIPTRTEGAEGRRLGRLLFGYSLGLDRWLQGIPHQFLLLDLGHIDLGFDPKNEVSRVYAYLGEKRDKVKEWLAACLWYTVTLEPPASLHKWGWRHKQLLLKAEEKGISVREWMDSGLSLAQL